MTGAPQPPGLLAAEAAHAQGPTLTVRQIFWRRFFRHRLAVCSLLFLILLALASAAAPLVEALLGVDGNQVDLFNAKQPPSAAHPLGTDELGRDLLVRLLYGGQVSLVVGLAAALCAAVIGTLFGLAAGYYGGRLDALLMRFTDLMMAFPALLLAIVLAAIFTPSLWIVALVIAMVNWVQVARVIYTETISLSERDFVEAERSLGASRLRILVQHIAPHLVSTMVVWATLGIATTVLLEATLSFLGIGVQPPTPSWGNIIFENQTYFTTAPWLVFIPGAAILLLALSFNVVGDALRDILDPKQKGRT